MRIFQIAKEQMLPISMDDAWAFLSNPANLSAITPPDMGFEILSGAETGETYAGQIIHYRVRPVAGIPMRWTTEISHCVPGKYFVDEQRFGPYAFWHHKHFLEPAAGGVLMRDVIDYALPFGVLGRVAHWIFVRRRLESIFEYRHRVLSKRFPVSER